MARFSLADFYFSLDADVLLTDPNTLTSLVNKNLMIVAPMLSSIGLYSNFWAGMSETYYYQRTDEYKKILNRKKVGCYQVPMVHTAVLIDLREEESDLLTYSPDTIEDYPGPRDDIIVLALSASLRGLPLHVCNDRHYGTLTLPLEEGQDLEHDKEILRFVVSRQWSIGFLYPIICLLYPVNLFVVFSQLSIVYLFVNLCLTTIPTPGTASLS